LIHIIASNKELNISSTIYYHIPAYYATKKTRFINTFLSIDCIFFSSSAGFGTQIIRKGFSARKNKKAESRFTDSLRFL